MSHRVVFPLELRLFNTVRIFSKIELSFFKHFFFLKLQSDDAVNPDRMYDLVAVVVHCGSGPNRGHYISIVKSCGFWLIFDDDIVDVSKIKSHLTENSKYLFLQKIEPSAIEDFYGLTTDIQKSSETGYILFYQSRDSTTNV